MHSISGHISLDDSANQIFLPEGKIIYICFCLYYESFFWIKEEKKIGLTGDLYLNIKEIVIRKCPGTTSGYKISFPIRHVNIQPFLSEPIPYKFYTIIKIEESLQWFQQLTQL